MKSQILMKKADHPIWGHIFEHVLSARIENVCLKNRLLRPIEFNILPLTSDDNVIFDLEKHPIKNIRLFEKTKFTKNEVIKAISEIACEYIRTFDVKDIDEVVSKINQVRNLRWENVYTTTAKKDIFVKNPFSDGNIFFKPKTRANFENFHVKLTLPAEFDELRPIAVFVFLIINWKQTIMLNQNHVCYEAGTEWNSWGDFTGHIMTIRFSKSEQMTQAKFSKEYLNNLDEIITNFQLSKKLIKYLTKTPTKNLALKPGEIDEYSRYIVGSRGWKSLAKSANISKILQNMEINFDFSRA
jgi:hypothetical protein